MASSQGTSQTSGGIGFFGFLALIFITLKLVGVAPVAGWSWWTVLSPLWGPVVAFVVIALIVLAFAVLKSNR